MHIHVRVKIPKIIITGVSRRLLITRHFPLTPGTDFPRNSRPCVDTNGASPRTGRGRRDFFQRPDDDERMCFLTALRDPSFTCHNATRCRVISLIKTHPPRPRMRFVVKILLLRQQYCTRSAATCSVSSCVY